MPGRLQPEAPGPAPTPAPGLISGSVWYTVLWAVGGAAAALLFFFAVQLPCVRDWRPTQASSSALRVSTSLKGRLRLLRAALAASEADVLARAGSDGRDYLQLLRCCGFVLAAAAGPALLGLLPLAVAGGGDATGFGRLTLQNLAPTSVGPALWAIVVCVCVNTACLTAAATHLEARLRGRDSDSLVSRCTLLLRGLPRRAARDRGQALQDLLERKFPGTVLKVYAHLDRRRERRLEQQLAALRDVKGRERLERQLAVLRAQPALGAGIAFVVFDSPASASAALKSLRRRRVALRGALGELANATLWRLMAARPGPLREPPMRAEPAPPPDSLLWHHIGLGPAGRALRTVAVNALLVMVLAVLSSPSLLAVVAFDAAGAGHQAGSERWARFVKHARGNGALAGLLFQFLPVLLSLLIATSVLPIFLRASTRAECHLSVGGFRQALISKSFHFNCVNILFVLAFGRAALAALAQRARDCDWARDNGFQQCTQSFVRLLEQRWIENSVASAMGLLSTASTFSIAWGLLDYQLLLSSLGRRLRLARGDLRAPLLEEGEGGEQELPRLLRWLTDPSPDALVFSQAHDLCLLTCALTFSILAPLVLLPGVLYFAFLVAAQKWKMMSSVAPRQGAADGRLSRAAASLLRMGLLIHVLSATSFVYVRGGRLQFALLAALSCGLLAAASARALFSSHAVADGGESSQPRVAVLAEAGGYAGEGNVELSAEDSSAPLRRQGSFRFSDSSL